MNRVLLFVVALVFASGCSILNKPDDKYLDANTYDTGDAGTDTMDAMDAMDTMDTNVPDTNPDIGRPFEQACGNGLDDDGDSLIDCDDYDCASEPSCCVAGMEILSTSWDTFRGWRATNGEQPVAESSKLVEFLSSDPIGLAYEECVPLAQGMKLEFRVTITDSESGFTKVVLGPNTMASPTDGLFADLGIRFDSGEAAVSGEPAPPRETHLEVGGESVWSASLDIGVTYRVSVDITPASRPVVGVEELVMLASVTMTNAADIDDTRESGEHLFITQEQLVRSATGTCKDIPGLFVAVEGVGETGTGAAAGEVGRLVVSEQTCANPAVFLEADATDLTFPKLGFTGETWGARRVSHPGLIEDVSGWTSVFEATNLDPGLVRAGVRVGYAVGQSSVGFWNDGDWIPAMTTPLIGSDPPSCMPGVPCAVGASMREPAIAVLGDGSRVLAHAEESATPNVFEAVVSSASLAELERISPTDMTSCGSVRDPFVLPVGTQLLVFFTCVTPPLEFGELYVTRLSQTFDVVPDSTQKIVFARSFADLGVRGPEAVVNYNGAASERRATIRLWYLGASVKGRGIGLATLIAPVDASDNLIITPDPETEGVAFADFPANPLLTTASPELECEDPSCEIEGFTVAARNGDATTVRFLVSRRVANDGDELDYSMIPLDHFLTSEL